MKDSAKRFPVDGTAALRIDDAVREQTQIIAFPAQPHRPLHAKPEAAAATDNPLAAVGSRLAEAVSESEMVRSLRHGTCAGKAVGRMTSLQAAGASLVFFVFLMGTLLFV